MINKVNEILQREVIRWDNIPTPKITEGYPNWKDINSYDTTSISKFTQSFVDIADKQHYYWLSKTEVTELLYKASVYGVSTITNLFN